MLRFTRGRLQQLQDGSNYLEFNTALLAFSTVACNLAAFLTNNDRGNNNVKAAEFVEAFRSRKGDLQGTFAKLEAQVFHLGKNRPAGESDAKFALSEAEAVSGWIEREMAAFIESLPDRSLWREERATPEVDSGDRFSIPVLGRQQASSSIGVLSGTLYFLPKRD